jgi:hypothetical protein
MLHVVFAFYLLMFVGYTLSATNQEPISQTHEKPTTMNLEEPTDFFLYVLENLESKITAMSGEHQDNQEQDIIETLSHDLEATSDVLEVFLEENKFQEEFANSEKKDPVSDQLRHFASAKKLENCLLDSKKDKNNFIASIKRQKLKKITRKLALQSYHPLYLRSKVVSLCKSELLGESKDFIESLLEKLKICSFEQSAK